MKSRVTRTALRWWAWPTILLALTFLIAPLLQVGFALLGRAISPGESTMSAYTVWPAQGEIVSTLTPALRWPVTNAGAFEIDIYEETKGGSIEWLTSVITEDNRAVVPEGTLSAERTYLWTVSAILSDSTQHLHAGRFSTFTSLSMDNLSITPAAYHLSLHSLASGVHMTVEVPEDTPVTISLPRGLTAGGSQRISAFGSFSLWVRPSIAFYLLRPRPDSPDARIAEIKVRTPAAEALIPVTVDVSTIGALQRTVGSGFDPVADTPGFSNFADGVLAQLTRGTCLGMILAAEANYQRCSGCDSDQDCACTRLRLQSLLRPDKVKEQMNFMHLANLDPQNWSTALSSLVSQEGQFSIAGEVLSLLRDGHPVPLAILPRTGANLSDPESNLGHAVLAYAAHEFEDLYIFYSYDPDEVYQPDSDLQSFIAIHRSGPQRGKVIRFSRGAEEEVEAYALPRSKVLSLVSSVMSAPYSALDGEFAAAISAR